MILVYIEDIKYMATVVFKCPDIVWFQHILSIYLREEPPHTIENSEATKVCYNIPNKTKYKTLN